MWCYVKGSEGGWKVGVCDGEARNLLQGLIWEESWTASFEETAMNLGL